MRADSTWKESWDKYVYIYINTYFHTCIWKLKLEWETANDLDDDGGNNDSDHSIDSHCNFAITTAINNNIHRYVYIHRYLENNELKVPSQ